jgi:hypothetical protein
MKLASLVLMAAAAAAFQIGTAGVALAAKEKFERSKPHVNIEASGRSSPGAAPQVAPRSANQPGAGPQLAPPNLSQPSSGSLPPRPGPDRHDR